MVGVAGNSRSGRLRRLHLDNLASGIMALMAELNLKEWTRDPTRDGFIRKSDKSFVGWMELGTTRAPTDKYLNDFIKRKRDAFSKPNKVRNYSCEKCGELLLRIYPWADIKVNNPRMLCKKCAYAQDTKVKR